jgi:Bacterial Ig domain/Calcineurin-like phosphoesterase/Purple acid Phosphatase, N-terminal domain
MNTKILMFFGFLVMANNAYTADEIHWTITGQTSVTFDWRGTSAENTISYGTSSRIYNNPGKVIIDNPSPLPQSSSGPFWEAKITGLQENTLYYYSVANGPEHTFHTPPPRGSSDFVVYAEGDVGSSLNGSKMPSVQALIANDLPNFVLVAGDIAYGETVVERTDQHFNDVMAWSQEAAYMPVWGNHDWTPSTSGLAQLNEYEGRFDFPNSQTSPGADADIGNGPGEDWYWFDYGNVRFIAYPEPFSGAWSDWNSKANTLMDAAQADGEINFIVTFGHRPAYSSGHHTGNSTLKDILDSLGDSHSKYVLNINGHSHNYERSFPQHRVIHLTVGTGGKGLEADGSCLWFTCTQPDWSDFRAMHNGITQLRFTKTGIQGSFICGPAEAGKDGITCNSGEVVDSFTIGTPTSVDNISPTVAITTPSDKANFSGTVSVSATATGNIGVVGVRFLLDGNNLGNEITTAPFSILWDTTTVANGSHSLSAVVRDANGNLMKPLAQLPLTQ